MLVLTRREGESIVITAGGERIVVTVTRVFGGDVRLGVKASPDVDINRDEIQAEIDRERAMEGGVR